jgi:hypothetical protein
VGFWDNLFRRTPGSGVVQATSPTVAPLGGSGRQHTGGFLDFDEINADLQGKAGVERFEHMWRTDADCRKAITMPMVPIVSGTWTMVPYSDDEDTEPTDLDREVAAFVWWNLTEAMRPKLKSHLWTALTVAGRAGFAPFEDIYRKTTWNGRDVFALATLSLKRPQSIDRWLQQGHELVGIEQFGEAVYPASNLLYYRFGAEGDNWEGQSLLRPAHKNLKYKEGLEEIDAIGHERTHIGVPTGYPPTQADANALDEFEDFLSNVRAAEAGFYMAPGPRADHLQGDQAGQGWFWEFVTTDTSQAAATAIQESLKYHRDSIAMTVIAEFMRLGQSGTGARATADVQQDPFWMYCDAIAEIVVADAINEQLIPRLVSYNYDTDRLPMLKCQLIDSTSLAELGDYIQKLAAAKALRPEPRLEAYLRERADLPEADEDAIAEQQELALKQAQEMAANAATDDPAAEDTTGSEGDQPPARETGPKKLDRTPRQLRSWEAIMSLDRIESEIDQARYSFEAAAGSQVRDLAISLADQASKGRQLKHAPAPAALVDAIHGQLAHLYRTGRSTVREELDRQRPSAIPAEYAFMLDDGELPRSLMERARAAADQVRAGIIGALTRTRLHKGQDAAALHLAAEKAGDAALRAQAQDHAAPALNEGRSDQADDQADEIAGTYYTSVLDTNRCQECKTADDDVLRTLDNPIRLARKPPNPDCNGGGRCRCLESFVLKTEAAPAA